MNFFVNLPHNLINDECKGRQNNYAGYRVYS